MESFDSVVNWILSDPDLSPHVIDTKAKGGSHNYKILHPALEYMDEIRGNTMNIYSVSGREIIKPQIETLLKVREWIREYNEIMKEKAEKAKQSSHNQGRKK